MYPHEHYHHGHPEMHNHGEGRPYVEPDWFANHHDGALPLVSTIGRGPKGYGLSIDKDEQGNLIVSSDDPMQEPETFHVGDWNIYVTQENNGEIPVGQNTKFTVHVEDGVRHVAKDIVVPCGARGTQFFIGGTNDPLHRRDDNTYVVDNVWPWTQDLNREYGIPDPLVGDFVMFDVDGNLAIGMIVQVADGHVVAYTDNLYFDWPIVNRPAPQLNINKVTYMSPECLGLKFYVGIPSIVRDEESYMKIEHARQSVESIQMDKNAEHFPGYGWLFEFVINAKEGNDDIVFTGWDESDMKLNILGPDGKACENREYHCTFVSMLDSIIANSSDPKVKAFAQAAKDYCIASQIDLEYHAEGLNVSQAVKNLDPAVLDPYMGSKTGTDPAGITTISYSCMLEENNTFRWYFRLGEGYSLDGYTFEIDGEPVSPKWSDNQEKYYLALDDKTIVTDLDKMHVYSISDGTDTVSITASCLSWARSSAQPQKPEAQRNVGKAMYLYYKAAMELFG